MTGKHKPMWIMTATLVSVPLSAAFADKLSDLEDADRYNEGCVGGPFVPSLVVIDLSSTS